MLKHDVKIGEAPCDKCSKALECGLEEKACLSFWQYVVTDRYNKKIRKIPTREIFIRVFEENDITLKELKAYAKELLKEQENDRTKSKSDSFSIRKTY